VQENGERGIKGEKELLNVRNRIPARETSGPKAYLMEEGLRGEGGRRFNAGAGQKKNSQVKEGY